MSQTEPIPTHMRYVRRLVRPRTISRDGQPCAYCQREMNIRDFWLCPTRDHAHPYSKGGRGGDNIVWCCRSCNNVKADLLEDQWQEFMRANPYWWARKRELPRFFALAPEPQNDLVIPTKVPLAYPDDPEMQAAHERIYKNRLRMLRVPKNEVI